MPCLAPTDEVNIYVISCLPRAKLAQLSRTWYHRLRISTVHRFVECSETATSIAIEWVILTGLTAVILRRLPAVWTLVFCVSGDGRVMTRCYQRPLLPSFDSRNKNPVKAARLLSSRRVNIGLHEYHLFTAVRWD